MCSSQVVDDKKNLSSGSTNNQAWWTKSNGHWTQSNPALYEQKNETKFYSLNAFQVSHSQLTEIPRRTQQNKIFITLYLPEIIKYYDWPYPYVIRQLCSFLGEKSINNVIQSTWTYFCEVSHSKNFFKSLHVF